MSRGATEHEQALAEIKQRVRSRLLGDECELDSRRPKKLTAPELVKLDVDRLRASDNTGQACKLTATELEAMRRRDRELAHARRGRGAGADDQRDLAEVVERALRSYRRGQDPTPYEFQALERLRGNGNCGAK